ncbi:MAG: methyltransferase domain-containing protein [Chitinivibrionales bacterium]|nr:methyltransferase domain-containing protein [Chitinivibrionales bacterium]
MSIKLDINLSDVQKVYSGPEATLWKLVMGEQIHIGGFAQSMVLAKKAGLKKGDKVLDLCSALGAGLRFLVKHFDVNGYGLDGTKQMVEYAQRLTKDENLSHKIEYKIGDVKNIPWPDRAFDVVWGEDAWCYVDCKDTLIKEASRVLKEGGTLAFSDWIEGSAGLSDEEARRICDNKMGMTFPYLETQKGYEALIKEHGLKLISSEDLNEHFAEMIELYINYLTKQVLYDALKILGDDMAFFQAKGVEMNFWLAMAKARKFSRGRWIAVKE